MTLKVKLDKLTMIKLGPFVATDEIKKIIKQFTWNQDRIVAGILIGLGIIVVVLFILVASFQKPVIMDTDDKPLRIRTETKCAEHQLFVIFQVNDKIFVKQIYKTKINDQFGYPELITTVECK